MKPIVEQFNFCISNPAFLLIHLSRALDEKGIKEEKKGEQRKRLRIHRRDAEFTQRTAEKCIGDY